MAKKKDSLEISKKIRFWDEMRDETIQVIFSIFSFLIVILSLLASFGKAGWIGDKTFVFLYKLFGVGYFLIPIMFVMLGISFLQSLKKRLEVSRLIGSLLFLISGLGLIHIIYPGASGIVGRLIASPLIKLVDYWATSIILFTLLVISIIITFNLYFTLTDLMNLFLGKKNKLDEISDKSESEVEQDITKNKKQTDVDVYEDQDIKQKETPKPIDNPQNKKKKSLLDFTDEEESGFATSVVVPHLRSFTPPPLSLLEKDRGKPETGDIKANANIIKRTLQNFSISVEMDEISIGPSVTRYALKPAEGVKLSRIIALNNDLALALAAHPIRIEAPIPGKSLVGIEVPNTAKTTVGLATLLSSPDYQESEKALLMSLGKDITGKAHFSNLAKAPHMLIAGTTGSGKSVTIHALVTSLLYRNSPQNLKFIMIDPKRVELTMYNKIPHLLTPVITDPKKAILALKWAAKEMSRRYDVLEQNKSRDIDSYHKTVLGPAMEKYKSNKVGDSENPKLPESMPYIAIFIDELADIMQTYPRELEAAIVRLAQMSRAVGIHLIISTQRPSVNVITGLIKANIPSRIALQVSSQIDSRTILDQMGAEKLLGAGDMLYLGGEMSKPVRLQSAYISESEVKRVVKYLIDEYKDHIIDEINLTPTEPGSSAAFDSMIEEGSLDDDDELYESVKTEVINSRKASTSYIQRKFGIGYSRAAKLIDTLQERGVVGPPNGSKPRDILVENTSETNQNANDLTNTDSDDALV